MRLLRMRSPCQKRARSSTKTPTEVAELSNRQSDTKIYVYHPFCIEL